MDPAELKVIRKSLGLSTGWLASRCGYGSDRHIRRMESGEAPVSPRVLGELHALEAHAEALCDYQLERVLEELGIEELESLEQLDEMAWPVIEVPRVDDGGEFPASFFHMVAARVRWELNGCCWLEYY